MDETCPSANGGPVGDDAFGGSLRRSLAEDGIDVDKVNVKIGERTGVACVWVEDETGENRIVIAPNANYSLKPKMFQDIPAPSPDLIILQLEIPLETVLHLDRSRPYLLTIVPRMSIPR